MEKEALSHIEALAQRKLSIHDSSTFNYILRAILASLFIGFGVVVGFKSGYLFHAVDSPFALPVLAFTFSVAILLIAYGGGDLFTGNTFYYSYAAMRKQMSWLTVGKLWGYSYIGNLIGAIIFALLVYGTGIFNDPGLSGFLNGMANTKASYPTIELFFRAILCNWLVCLAFFLPYRVKGDGAKIFIMLFLVVCFFVSGYEHSIANMSLFAISVATQAPDAVPLDAIIHNLIPVTIGNLVGATLFMSYMYYFLNKPFKDIDGDTM